MAPREHAHDHVPARRRRHSAGAPQLHSVCLEPHSSCPLGGICTAQSLCRVDEVAGVPACAAHVCLHPRLGFSPAVPGLCRTKGCSVPISIAHRMILTYAAAGLPPHERQRRAHVHAGQQHQHTDLCQVPLAAKCWCVAASFPCNKPRQMSALTCMQRYASYTRSNHFDIICDEARFQLWRWVPKTPCKVCRAAFKGNQRHREPCRPS